jgi:hypothetical protein
MYEWSINEMISKIDWNWGIHPMTNTLIIIIIIITLIITIIIIIQLPHSTNFTTIVTLVLRHSNSPPPRQLKHAQNQSSVINRNRNEVDVRAMRKQYEEAYHPCIRLVENEKVVETLCFPRPTANLSWVSLNIIKRLFMLHPQIIRGYYTYGRNYGRNSLIIIF